MSLKLNFAWMLGSRAMVMAAGVLTSGMINRALGPAGRGVYAEMQTWVGLFLVLFGMSVQSGIYHHANRVRYGADDKSRFVTVAYMTALQCLVAASGLVVFVRLHPGHVSYETTLLIPYLSVLLAVSMVASNLSVFAQSLGEIRLAAVVGVIQSAVMLGTIGYGFLGGSLDLVYVLCSLIASQTAVWALFTGVLLKRHMGSGRFSGEGAKTILWAGAKQHIATIATFVYTKINQLIVFQYAGEAEAGTFAVALSLALNLAFIPETLGIVLYPRVIHSSDDHEITIRSMRLTLYGGGLGAAAMALLAGPIIKAYAGEGFSGSVGTFRILLVATWFLPVSSLLAPYYIKKGAFGLASVSAVMLGVISVILNWILVPRYLSEGAAWATALTCFIGFVMVCFFLRYLSHVSPLRVLVPDFKKEAEGLMRLFRSANG